MDGGVFCSHNACRAVVACGGKKQGWRSPAILGTVPIQILSVPLDILNARLSI